MKVVLGVVVGVAKFLYSYIFGDDWTVAVVMLLALAGTAALVAGGINAWWLVPPLAVIMTGVSLIRRKPVRRT